MTKFMGLISLSALLYGWSAAVVVQEDKEDKNNVTSVRGKDTEEQQKYTVQTKEGRLVKQRKAVREDAKEAASASERKHKDVGSNPPKKSLKPVNGIHDIHMNQSTSVRRNKHMTAPAKKGVKKKTKKR